MAKSSNATAIHLNYEKKETTYYREEGILPADNTINIVVDTDTIKAPHLQNGDIITHEEDLMSDNFFTLLIDRMNFILCHMK